MDKGQSIQSDKQIMRKEMRARLRENSTDRDRTARQARCAAGNLLSSGVYADCSAVFAFLSYGTEISTWELVRRMLADGKRVAVPRTDGDDMDFHYLDAAAPLESQLEEGDFGILVPRRELPAAIPEKGLLEKLMVLVPGVVFARDGYRIGQGRGFYDRWFARMNAAAAGAGTAGCAGGAGLAGAVLAGYCHAFQVADSVPHDSWDIPVSYIISDEGIFSI